MVLGGFRYASEEARINLGNEDQRGAHQAVTVPSSV
jgi:hypothetical protein